MEIHSLATKQTMMRAWMLFVNAVARLGHLGLRTVQQRQ